MRIIDYSQLSDQVLGEMMLNSEDRLELAAAQEIARRASMVEPLSALLIDKQNWLADLPDFWAVVHATFILGFRGGTEAVCPLLSALRWADAYDCDWVMESLPSIFGSLAELAHPGLEKIAHDPTAGWSARGAALQSLAAVSLKLNERAEHIFKLIGDIFMNEAEDRWLRQVAGNILLDFRQANYRMALTKFAREEAYAQDIDSWYAGGFSNDDVDFAFHQSEPDTWFYQEDWMRFYSPREIQRRQKRWQKERMTRRNAPGGPGRIINLWRPADSPFKPEQE